MTRRSRLGILSTVTGLLGSAAALGAGAGTVPGVEQLPYTVSVLVDGAPAPEYAARGRIYVEALKGREFTIRLCNPTGERVAVALSVDGRNVVDAGRTTALAAAKWILMPHQTTEIPGWQISGQTSRKFFFTETSHSYAKWLGDTANVGTIEAVFFREKRRPVPPVAAYREQSLKDEAPSRETAQAPSAANDQAAGSAEGGASDGLAANTVAPEPQSKARAAAKTESFAATGIGRETSFPIQWTSFDEEPRPAATVAIRYEFHEQLVRLGVLPREEDLYARENARGFEHAYAPDPYRPR